MKLKNNTLTTTESGVYSMAATSHRLTWQVMSSLLVIACLYSGKTWSAERVIPQPESQLAKSITIHYKNLRMGDEIVELSNGSESYWALYQQNRTASPQGGALLIHDQAQTMDWPIMLQEVRTYLPDTGWDTLSITMPEAADQFVPARAIPPIPDIFDFNLSFKEQVHSRIDEGINELNQRGIQKIVLIGYGTGSHWAANYLADKATDNNNAGYALIIIDAREPSNDPVLDLDKDLSTLTIPILDVHFSNSKFEIQKAKLRKGAILRAGYENFTQVKEAKLNSEFASGPGRVTRRIWGWLKTNASDTDENKDL